MHTVRCECAVYRPGNCRETPKNLIFQEREKELREEHRRHRRFRDRDDDELRTEDKTMCFATKKSLEKLRSREVKKLNIQSSWTLEVELRELQIGQRQTLRALRALRDALEVSTFVPQGAQPEWYIGESRLLFSIFSLSWKLWFLSFERQSFRVLV